MIHGQHPLLEESGSSLQLTRLGRKIPVLEDQPLRGNIPKEYQDDSQIPK